ncbi:MoaD/ThiS family protein [Metabacillus sp. RGM 3146]|uniref:MoaD/ThiS family protein n=1 Tax=Metabacillus sp. RGM 3146 TaxID=3401092 RepID=UPI003B9AFA8F
MITVLCFAGIKDLIGQGEFKLDIKEISVDELLKEISREHQLQLPDSLMVAVNEEYADPSEIVYAGSTVALIPPVSGG